MHHYSVSAFVCFYICVCVCVYTCATLCSDNGLSSACKVNKIKKNYTNLKIKQHKPQPTKLDISCKMFQSEVTLQQNKVKVRINSTTTHLPLLLNNKAGESIHTEHLCSKIICKYLWLMIMPACPVNRSVSLPLRDLSRY